MFKSLIKIDFSSEIIFAFFLFCTYIYWSVMCRFSRRVQDFYCSVQNVQDKQAVVQRCFEQKFCTQRASCTLRKKRHMTDQQIYFSGWTGFVHTCLGLICENWNDLPNLSNNSFNSWGGLETDRKCSVQKGWHENFLEVQ